MTDRRKGGRLRLEVCGQCVSSHRRRRWQVAAVEDEVAAVAADGIETRRRELQIDLAAQMSDSRWHSDGVLATDAHHADRHLRRTGQMHGSNEAAVAVAAASLARDDLHPNPADSTASIHRHPSRMRHDLASNQGSNRRHLRHVLPSHVAAVCAQRRYDGGVRESRGDENAVACWMV